MKDDANDAVRSTQEQKTKVEQAKRRVEVAQSTYDSTKACPAQLRELEDQLAEMEADPNDSEADIDAECQKKKEILQKQKCSEAFAETEVTLRRSEESWSSAKEELSQDRMAAKNSVKVVEPHQMRADEARRALDDARE